MVSYLVFKFSRQKFKILNFYWSFPKLVLHIYHSSLDNPDVSGILRMRSSHAYYTWYLKMIMNSYFTTCFMTITYLMTTFYSGGVWVESICVICAGFCIPDSLLYTISCQDCRTVYIYWTSESRTSSIWLLQKIDKLPHLLSHPRPS